MTRKLIIAVLALALLLAVAIPVLTTQGAAAAVDDGSAITRIHELDGQMTVADPECPPPTGSGGCG
ncbi:MAG: hypothetical protein L0154_05165 [Chloroflexi bacterium]|nr:hypothetical protein [Chloroflexota bacterium]